MLSLVMMLKKGKRMRKHFCCCADFFILTCQLVYNVNLRLAAVSFHCFFFFIMFSSLLNDWKSYSYCFISTILLKTAINWWWSWKGQRIPCRYNCILPGKAEDIGPCCKCRRSSFKCCRKETHAGLQWETCSFTSSTWVLPGIFLSNNSYWSFNSILLVSI